MPTSRRPRSWLLWSSLSLGACAGGVEEPSSSSFTGPYGGPADDPYGGSGYEEDGDGDGDGGSMPPPGGSAGGPAGDGGDTGGGEGNPLCCEVHPTAGCEAAMTEACVCAVLPSCCQTVWTQECVDLAVSCGDPFCEGEPDDSGGSGGDPPPDDSGGDPPPDDSGGDPPPTSSCPCSGDPAFDNFCFYAPGTPDCPMTHAGGYCDPNGDGSYTDGDWVQGYNDYAASC